MENDREIRVDIVKTRWPITEMFRCLLQRAMVAIRAGLVFYRPVVLTRNRYEERHAQKAGEPNLQR
jgi:hypothetical protein